ncbi:hypothetical protein ACIBEJ_00760 [Nonomuraea sp. NPDC050790]|uniref:hypothetical protein n=1 Tax=Nonomuraea sp. NPDC050790 TaxID=3364371 RepID=UPI0037B8C142
MNQSPEDRTPLTIVHTRAAGTLIEGTRPGDGVLDIVRRHGFMLFRSESRIGIRRSTGRTAKLAKINGAVEALRAAGFTVTVDISADDPVRIVHTRARGTHLLGASSGDGVWNVARDHGFYASRHSGIFVPRSAGAPNKPLITDAARALREAGFAVTLDIEE